MRQVVLASSNAGKLAEFAALLRDAGFEVVPQSAFGVADAIEDGTTFVDNALIKARHAAAATGLPAIADDSGLVVPALGGAPGVLSARYAGTHGDAAANNAKLVDAMRGLRGAERSAWFECALAFVRDADDPDPIVAQGRWHGHVLDAPRGAGGFGYDPLFLDPATGRTAAELPPETKNAISHRGRALARLRERIAAAAPPGDGAC